MIFSFVHYPHFIYQDLRTPDCSCPFLNPDKSGIHRALITVSSGDESPNYRSTTLGTEALTVQLRKSYLFNIALVFIFDDNVIAFDFHWVGFGLYLWIYQTTPCRNIERPLMPWTAQHLA